MKMSNNNEIKIDQALQNRIEKYKGIIESAIDSNNLERLKGILQVCMVGTEIDEESLDKISNFAISAVNNELSEEDIEKISGGGVLERGSPLAKFEVFEKAGILLLSLGSMLWPIIKKKIKK